MPLKITCPHCGKPTRLDEPLPLPGSEVLCDQCARTLVVSYPPGAMDALKAKGKVFQSEESAAAALAAKARSVPAAPPPPSPQPVVDTVPPIRRRLLKNQLQQNIAAETAAATAAVAEPPTTGTSAATAVDATQVRDDQPDTEAGIERTVPSGRTPDGSLPMGIPEADAEQDVGIDHLEPTAAQGVPAPSAAEPTAPLPSKAAGKGKGKGKGKGDGMPPQKAKKKKKGCFRRLLGLGLVATLVVGCTGVLTAGGGYLYYSRDLPTIEALQAYEPPAVTVVYDHEGRVLGEIYEERRYVVPLEEIPEDVQNAFIAAEDANFWNHGGVDFVGLTRAMIENVRTMSLAQGASTITQQVTRNFLLSREKKIERKVKEMILAWRIEDAYDKNHILYLYLNQIYLGSQAYGVDAAARTYFDKPIQEVTLAEAAILAGLPQRPSDYSPHRHWEKAKARQTYVLRQMLEKGYITQQEHDAALAEHVRIVERRNIFLEQAPHFTEHVRRYLVDKYGEERVLHEGLQVVTTCDLDLQRVGQQAVTEQVFEVDQRMGFRREAITTVPADQIQAKRDEHELAMRKAWARHQDAAGRVDPPEVSILEEGEVYDAVILEVKKNYARIAVGAHEGIIPLTWHKWVYKPNPKRSWRYRDQTNLTELVDDDGDRKKDGSILRKGDVVLVKVDHLSTQHEDVKKAFRRTPGEDEDLLALRLWQVPEIEAAMFSFDLDTGAVRTMVGGSNFRKSQFNRATQSRRQVGSTFKPIVYGAAIESEKVTTATMVADAPIAFAATTEDFIWKPANYGNDYLGNITLRRALAMSRNTCTIRVLEAIDPGMNDDVVYSFARKLGIGGPPTYALPEDWVPSQENDLLCPWVRETPDSTICMDRNPPKDPELSNTRHRQLMGPDDVYMCRACDMSMGLGSASLTMEELARAYSAFATDGYLVEPYYIVEVRDRKGNVLERHEPQTFEQVLEPDVSSIVRWLLRGVVEGGTAARAQRLGLHGLAGKTGTTNDEKDTWFVGFTNDIIATAWVGYDQPRTLGISSTGGRTALPIWMDYMEVAAPKERDRYFHYSPKLEWIQIDPDTGRRVTDGGHRYPFLEGTAPEETGIEAGQLSVQDLSTEL